MVDLEGDGAQKQHNEAVVDHRMDDTHASVPHQCLHPQTLAQTSEPLPPVAPPGLGPALEPRPRPLRQQVESQPEKSGNTHIEDGYNRLWHVSEHLAADVESRMPGDRPQHSEKQRGHGREHTQRFKNHRHRRRALVSVNPGFLLRGGGHSAGVYIYGEPLAAIPFLDPMRLR